MSQVRLGYACINNSLTYPRGRKDYYLSYKLSIHSRQTSKQPEGSIPYSRAAYNFLIKYGLKNTADIIEVLKWHVKHGLSFYRMSSDLFPHVDNELLQGHMTQQDIEDYRNLSPFRTNIEQIADIAFKHNIRLTMHPDPFAVLASPDESKYKTQ